MNEIDSLNGHIEDLEDGIAERDIRIRDLEEEVATLTKKIDAMVDSFDNIETEARQWT